VHKYRSYTKFKVSISHASQEEFIRTFRTGLISTIQRMNTPPATPSSLETVESSNNISANSNFPEIPLASSELSNSREETENCLLNGINNKSATENGAVRDDVNKSVPTDSTANVGDENVKPQTKSTKPALSTLWSLFKDEITASDSEHGHDAVAERVTNFLEIPRALEEVRIFFRNRYS
jgi:hypothetical protein